MPVCVGGPKDGEIVEKTNPGTFEIFYIPEESKIGCFYDEAHDIEFNRYPYQTRKITYKLMPFASERDRFYVWVPMGQTTGETMALLIYNYMGQVGDKSDRKKTRLS